MEHRSGSSLSNCKDPVELESWDKDAISTGGSGSGNGTIIGGNGSVISSSGRQLPPIVSSPNNAPTPPSYHISTQSSAYLYPEGYSRMNLKVRTH